MLFSSSIKAKYVGPHEQTFYMERTLDSSVSRTCLIKEIFIRQNSEIILKWNKRTETAYQFLNSLSINAL
jgi:hypothetical protein